MTPGPDRQRALRLLGTGVFLLALAASAQIGSQLTLGFDLLAYWDAGRHVAAGEPFYRAEGEALGQLGEFRYPPHVALAFVPLAALPLPVAKVLWLAVQVAVAGLVGIALLRRLPAAARPWAAAGYVLYLPLVLEVVLGNLNLLTLALCLLAWRWRDRPALAGGVLAAGLGLKLLPFTLIPFYLAAGRIRTVLWCLATGLVVLIGTAIVLPVRLAEFLALLLRLTETPWVRTAIDREQPELLATILWSRGLTVILALLAVAIAITAGRAAARRGTDETHLHALALATAPYLAPFAVFWTTFLVFSLPLFASTLGRALSLDSARGRALAAAALACCWLLIQVVRLHDLMPIAAHLSGVVALCLLAVVLLPTGPDVQAREGRLTPEAATSRRD